jgi:hypothetical protein
VNCFAKPASCRPLVVQSISDLRWVRTFQGPGSRRFLRVGQRPMPTTGRSWPRPPVTNHRSGCPRSEQAGAAPAVGCPPRSFVAARGPNGPVSGLRRASDDTPMLAAVSGTGRGRGGSQPPPGLSAVPAPRPCAGRWLLNPPGLFVGARGRGCLASGVPHALGDAVMPAAPGRARSGLVVSNVRRSRPVVSAPNHHPAERASSAATAKPPISRAIRQRGKGRRIRTAKSPAIGESLADESWPADPFRNRPLAATD